MTEELKRRKEIPSFDEYLESQSQRVARWFAEHLELADQCEERGMAAPFSIPSVGAAVSTALSYVYGRACEDEGIKRSDGDDLRHALIAIAGSDVFVTHDPILANLLNRIPKKVAAVSTLQELLCELS